MLITCPECSTRYRVDDTSIGPEGRTVKCARCGHRWHEAPQTAAAAVPEPEAAAAGGSAAEPQTAATADGSFADAMAEATEAAEAAEVAGEGAGEASADAPEAALRGERARARAQRGARRQPERTRRSPAGWLTLAAIVLLLVCGGYVFRTEVVAFWPPAGKLYREIGLQVNPVELGLEVRNVASSREVQGGQRFLVVTGEVWNVSTAIMEVPPLRVSLNDENDNELSHWMVTATSNPLGPQESVKFSTRLNDPPDAARRLAITFQVEG